MGAHLTEKAKALDDTIVQVDEFRLSELVNVNFHRCVLRRPSRRTVLEA
jgi:hypothetical protein